MSLSRTVRMINQQYGPYAFGLVTMLVVWHVVVKPDQEQRRTQNEKIVEALKESAAVQKEVSDTLKSLTTKIESMDQRLGEVERSTRTHAKP